MMMLQQIGYAGPSLLVFLLAACMAVIYLNRARLPAILTLIGAAISIVTVVGSIVIQAIVLSDDSLSSQRAVVMQSIGLASSVLRAAGLALIVAAVFVGRTPPRPEDRYLRE